MKLKPEHAGERERLAERARRELAGLPMVLGLSVGLPADPPSEKAWDLSYEIRLAGCDDLAAWRDHPTHRAYVDEALAPRAEVVKAWNFQTA